MAPVLTLDVSHIKTGHIDDVQELKNRNSKEIPERFIKDSTERPQLIQEIPSQFENVPIIDLSKLVDASKQDFHSEMSKLIASCEEWGFFQVINHGIDVEVLDSLEKVALDFFMMPLEEKKKYPMLPGLIQGYGQAFIFSEEQKLDWCNMYAIGIEPKNMREPRLWPTKPSEFGPTLEAYSKEIGILCKNVMKYIAISLGLKDDIFDEMFGEAVQAVRMNYYPACPRPDLAMGLSSHSDGSAITILQQGKGNHVGLQIMKDGNWIPVQPITNALVINIGDTLEVLTNGRYKSIEHRAVTNKETDRLSVVTFYAPNYAVELGPIPELLDEDNVSKYKRYNHGEYTIHYVTNKLQGKKTLDEFAKI